MITPAGDAPAPADTPSPTEAEAILRDAEDRAAAIVRDAEARARRILADAVRTGRDRLDEIAAEEREARLRLQVVQHELRHIVERITQADETVIDLTGAEVRFGLSPRAAARSARAPAPSTTDDDELVDTMVRRAVDEALAHAAAPAGR